MSHLVAIANQKGGVGKTTTAVTLGHAFSLAGEATLIVDLDPQGSATTGLGVAKSRSGLLSRILLGEEPTTKLGMLVRSVDAGLDLIPCDTTAEDKGSNQSAASHLRKALDELRGQYSWILVDCPPSKGFLTTCAIVAADYVLMPVQSEFFALDGANEMMAFVEEMNAAGDTSAIVQKIVVTMYRDGNTLAQEVLLDLERQFPEILSQTIIPRDGSVAEASGYGKTVYTHAPESLAARAYTQLAKELLDHVG